MSATNENPERIEITPRKADSPATNGSDNEDYNPVTSLRKEVERFKATNQFSPMLVTNFYAQAACVLTYVGELEEELKRMISRAEYVCAHKYGERTPVGTRIIQLNHAKRVLRCQNAEVSASGDENQKPL